MSVLNSGPLAYHTSFSVPELSLILQKLFTNISHKCSVLVNKTWYSFFIHLSFFNNAISQIIQYKSQFSYNVQFGAKINECP
jgi:hypothetical protein